jgi:uncharacterized protein
MKEANMKVAVTGSSGLIGSALCTYITQKGHEVLRIVRKKTSDAEEIFWNKENGKLEEDKLEAVDAIVHLAGESIACFQPMDRSPKSENP